MRFSDYCKDKASVWIVNGAGLLVLSLFLWMLKNSTTAIFLIVVAWIGVLLAYALVDYGRRRRYFAELEGTLEELDQRYLLAEVMGEPYRLEDRLYREILRKSNKSVIEKINELARSQREYKEYIESWIHQVKTPMTAIHLICENHKNEQTRKILAELSDIENQVEMVLYYARMEQAYQDYLIHRANLREVVLSAIWQEKQHFLICGMQIECEMEDMMVSTDEKWVEFLLRQIFSNSMKYRRKADAKLRIYAKRGERQCSLYVEDNGIGIAPEDLGRIFDKGFTGKNGRAEDASTGIGLYLCRRLCEKLGLGIACESEEGAFTRMILTFPNSEYNRILKTENNCAI